MNVRWLLWSLFVIAWTTALIIPFPDEITSSVDEIMSDRKYMAAKSVHIIAYAVFAILCAWVRVPLRYRWLMAAFLVAHGGVTEFIQENFTNHTRNGELTDVVFDIAGAALGMLLSWKWWTSSE